MFFKKEKIVLHFLCYSPRIYSALDRFTIHLSKQLKEKGYKSIFIFNDELGIMELESDILKSGAEIELLDTKRGSANLIKELNNLLKKYKPEIIHSHFEFNIKTFLAILSFLYGIRFYFSAHSFMTKLSPKEYKMVNGLYSFYRFRIHLLLLLILCKKTFCVSEAVKNEFTDYAGINSSKLLKLYLGVKIFSEKQDKKRLREKLNLHPEKILIVNISAIEYIKGIDLLLKAAAILNAKFKLNNFQIIHVGGLRAENDFNKNYEKELKELQKKISNNFLWLGKRNDIHNILSACDIYVHPSRMEGLPTTLMEASASHLPLIGSNVGGIPEIIQNNVNGILVEPENEIQLADALYYLISNEKLRKKLGDGAYSYLHKNWDMENQAIKLMSAYGI